MHDAVGVGGKPMGVGTFPLAGGRRGTNELVEVDVAAETASAMVENGAASV